jgi:hypothetical protein
MQNKIQSFWEWIVFSSKDSAKWSLTIKGAVPFILILLSWKGLTVDGNLLNQFIDQSINILVLIVQLGSACTALFGLGRKIYLSINKSYPV